MLVLVSLFIFAFLAITFLQSGYDKTVKFSENTDWLRSHFKDTFLRNQIPFAVTILLIFEIVTGLLCVASIAEMIFTDSIIFPKYALSLSCITFLMLLFGQRIANDYDGARTIAIYFIIAILGLFSMSYIA